jgi:AcrR family transcriptional regulator
MVGLAAEHDSGQRGYHHGNLRGALVEAGVELARTGGPNAVLLRAVSRQAGVSHNAAYRHFASQEDLLAAVAARCMTQLGLLMLKRCELVSTRGAVQRARARLTAIGRAYVDFARTEPGWFRTAFSSARAHQSPPSPHDQCEVDEPDADAETNPYVILSARLDELVSVGAITPQRRVGAEYAAWSAVHGLSSLLLDGPLHALPDAEVEAAMVAVLGLVNRGLQ